MCCQGLHLCLQTSHHPAHHTHAGSPCSSQCQCSTAQNISNRSPQGPSRIWEAKHIYFNFFYFWKLFFPPPQTLLRSFRPGTVLEINGLQVKLVISSTPYCLCTREGPCSFNFVCWKKILVPCLFCFWASGSRERDRRGLSASSLILDLLWCKTWLWEGKGRQCIYCSQTLFGGSESPWACCLPSPCCPAARTPHLPYMLMCHPSACGAGGHERPALRMGTGTQVRSTVGQLSGGEQLNDSVQHVKRCSSTAILPGGLLSWKLASDPSYKQAGFGV